jgi:hypothetical protein
MPVKFGSKPYRFDYNNSRQHHFGRCYISNAETCHTLLSKLYEHKRLMISDITAVYPTTRAEMARELFIEMWRIGLPIGIERHGMKKYAICYLGKTPPPAVNKLDSIIKEKRKHYPYTLFFLDEFNSNPDGLSEKDMVKLLFNKKADGSYSKGCNDQVHPTNNDLKAFGYVEGKVKPKITSEGIELLKSFDNNLTFICFSLDLNGDKFKMRMLWSIMKAIQQKYDGKSPLYPFIKAAPPFEIDFKDISALHNGKGLGKSTPIENPSNVSSLLRELGIKFNYKTNSNTFNIKDQIFFSITPAEYVSCSLSIMDDISHFINTDEQKADVGVPKKKISNKMWFITDKQIKPKITCPYVILNYTQWQEFKEKLPDELPDFIVIGEGWHPVHLEASCGHLFAYIKNGGNVIIHGPQGGRVGANRQFLNWLPQDFERLNYMPDSKAWSFDMNRLPEIPVDSIYCSSFSEPNLGVKKLIDNFSAKYYQGNFIFEGKNIADINYDDIVQKYSNRPQKSFRNSPEWQYKHIASLHRNSKVTKEEHTYPIIGCDILVDFFGFELSTTFCHSWSGGGSIKDYVDLFTIYPALTLWEVDSIKGKGGLLGGMAGDSLAIDQTHATKVEPYRKRAEKQYLKLLDFILASNSTDIDSFIVDINLKINSLPTSENFQMQETFDVYLTKYRITKKAFNKNAFYIFIEKCNMIIKKPVTALLGVSYGFAEGQKYSAREYSIADKYSLWSYRDLYELIVRLSPINDMQKRRDILLHILSLKNGPVYFEIKKHT